MPKSMGMSLRSCEMDVRVGGKYRLEFEPDAMAFFGTYLEVTPHSRLVWTNEEGGEGGPVTTVTFEEQGGKTLLVMHELIPRRKLSTLQAPGRRMRWSRRSSNWTSFSSPWALAWDGHEVVNLAVSAHKAADDAPARWPTRNRPSHSACQGRAFAARLFLLPTGGVAGLASDVDVGIKGDRGGSVPRKPWAGYQSASATLCQSD